MESCFCSQEAFEVKLWKYCLYSMNIPRLYFIYLFSPSYLLLIGDERDKGIFDISFLHSHNAVNIIIY